LGARRRGERRRGKIENDDRLVDVRTRTSCTELAEEKGEEG
jgi:hypothetical protein